MHRHTDGVAYNIIRYSGDVNGAIVCLGIRHGVASLIVVDATLCLGGCIQWCKELQESSFKEIISINLDNLPEALAMQHDIAMENVRRTGRKIGKKYISP